MKSAVKQILFANIGMMASIELINPIKDTILNTGIIAIFARTEYIVNVLK